MSRENINTAAIDALTIVVGILIKSVDETTQARIEHRLKISIDRLQRGVGEYAAFPDRQFVAEILSEFLENVP